MKLEDLVKKVTSDTSKSPYITLDDIQDVVNERKELGKSIATITKERDDLKASLDKKTSDYELLRSRIVDSVLSGQKLNETKPNEKKPSDRENLSWDDLIKKGEN